MVRLYKSYLLYQRNSLHFRHPQDRQQPRFAMCRPEDYVKHGQSCGMPGIFPTAELLPSFEGRNYTTEIFGLDTHTQRREEVRERIDQADGKADIL